MVDLVSSWGPLCATRCAVSGKGRITRLCLGKPQDSYFICHESGNTWPWRVRRSLRRVTSSLTPRNLFSNGVYADFYNIILVSSFVGVGDFSNLPIAQRSGNVSSLDIEPPRSGHSSLFTSLSNAICLLELSEIEVVSYGDSGRVKLSKRIL